MGNSTADCHQQAMMRSFAVALLLFSSGVLGDLECWMGGCGISIEGAVEMPDCTDSDPSLEKGTCPTNFLCAMAEGNHNSSPFKYWGCDLVGGSNTGCFNVTGDLNSNDQLGGGFSNVEACFCDTALCNNPSNNGTTTTTKHPSNSASKQTLTAIFAVLLVIHYLIN